MTTQQQKPTIQVYKKFTFSICNGKCEKRAMIGSTWYKQYGYNSPCQCLKTKVKLEYMDVCYCCKKFVNKDDNTTCVEAGGCCVCLECYETYFNN